MRNRERKKISTFYFIKHILDKYQVFLSERKEMHNSIQKYLKLLDELQELENEHKQSHKWITKNKEIVRTDLVDNVYALMVALVRLGNDIENIELQVQFKLSKTKLVRKRDFDLIGFARLVIKYSYNNLTELKKFEIDDLLLNKVEAQTKEFNHLIGFKAGVLKGNKNNYNDLIEQIDKINLFFKNEFDWCFKAFEHSNPELYFDYFAAKKVKKTKTSNIDLRGTVVDNATNLPVRKGVVKILELDVSTKITNKGYFEFKNVAAGQLTLDVDHMQYQSKQVIVQRYKTDKINLEIRLDPISISDNEQVVFEIK